jgi:hypothetical protein
MRHRYPSHGSRQKWFHEDLGRKRDEEGGLDTELDPRVAGGMHDIRCSRTRNDDHGVGLGAELPPGTASAGTQARLRRRTREITLHASCVEMPERPIAHGERRQNTPLPISLARSRLATNPVVPPNWIPSAVTAISTETAFQATLSPGSASKLGTAESLATSYLDRLLRQLALAA